MAKKKTKQEQIELKYGRLVRKAYSQYKTRSWGEFMSALDELKREMAKEMEEAGLLKEETVKNDLLPKDEEET